MLIGNTCLRRLASARNTGHKVDGLTNKVHNLKKIKQQGLRGEQINKKRLTRYTNQKNKVDKARKSKNKVDKVSK